MGAFGPQGKKPDILIIAPPPIRDNVSSNWTASIFGKGCVEKSKSISGEYQKIAKNYRCHFLDMAAFAETSSIDSVHMDAANHEKFALAVSKKIQEIFK